MVFLLIVPDWSYPLQLQPTPPSLPYPPNLKFSLFENLSGLLGTGGYMFLIPILRKQRQADLRSQPGPKSELQDSQRLHRDTLSWKTKTIATTTNPNQTNHQAQLVLLLCMRPALELGPTDIMLLKKTYFPSPRSY